MDKHTEPMKEHPRGVRKSLRKSLHALIHMLLIILGMLLLSSLVLTLLPQQVSGGLFGHGLVPDTLIGAGLGSVAVGHPLASYLIGGGLLEAGVGLAAVTALMVAWVTVGWIQLPAESMLLGGRFALLRNGVSLVAAVAIAFLCAAAVKLLELA